MRNQDDRGRYYAAINQSLADTVVSRWEVVDGECLRHRLIGGRFYPTDPWFKQLPAEIAALLVVHVPDPALRCLACEKSSG